MKKFNLRSLLCLAIMMLSIATNAQEVRTFQFNHTGKTGFKMTEQTTRDLTSILLRRLCRKILTSVLYTSHTTKQVRDFSIPSVRSALSYTSTTQSLLLIQHQHMP